MAEKHPIHYYTESGDIILQVENVHFLVHKTYLSLASEFFKNFFARTKLTSNEIIEVTYEIIEITNEYQKNFIPIIKVTGENSSSIQDMLSFIYPNTIFEINWENIKNWLRLYDKFIIKKLKYSCELFFENNFTGDVLTSFILADQYRFPTVFKEASKLILDDFIKYESDDKFKQISERTQERLKYSRYLYYSTLDKLNTHYSNDYMYGMVKKVCTYPIPKPSFVWNTFDTFEWYFKNYLDYLKTFERLNKGMDKNSYPFIELE